jgi:signal peptidase I
MRLRLALEAAVMIAVALTWFIAVRPVALGGPASYIVVRGYSMSGTLAPGDLVVTMAQGSYSVGDAIVYRTPMGAGRGLLVVHRIVGADPSGYRMQGDANSYQDPWRPKISDVVGRVVATVPGLGRILALLTNPFVLAICWGLAALIMGLSFLPDSRGPQNNAPTNPTRPARHGPRTNSTVAAATALSVSGMVGLLVLSAGMVIDPAWNLGAAILSAGVAMTALTFLLFFLPGRPILRFRPLLSSKSRRRRRWVHHPAFEAAPTLAAAFMVGLVVLSAAGAVSKAHAAGLNVHNPPVTARVAHCSAPPPFPGICS